MSNLLMNRAKSCLSSHWEAASVLSVLSSTLSCKGSLNFEMLCDTELLLFEKLIYREFLDNLN